jgi:hypothetical protein
MRPTLAALLAAVPPLLLACSEGPATSVPQPVDAAASTPAAHRGPDDGDSDRDPKHSIRVRGDLSDGRTFTGTMRVREFIPRKGQATGGSIAGVAHGDIEGRAKGSNTRAREISQSFVAPMTLSAGAGHRAGSLEIIPAQAQSCSILVIDVGVIDINALGPNLHLRLSLIRLDVGAGGLAGTLLCSLLQPQV